MGDSNYTNPVNHAGGNSEIPQWFGVNTEHQQQEQQQQQQQQQQQRAAEEAVIIDALSSTTVVSGKSFDSADVDDPGVVPDFVEEQSGHNVDLISDLSSHNLSTHNISEIFVKKKGHQRQQQQQQRATGVAVITGIPTSLTMDSTRTPGSADFLEDAFLSPMSIKNISEMMKKDKERRQQQQGVEGIVIIDASSSTTLEHTTINTTAIPPPLPSLAEQDVQTPVSQYTLDSVSSFGTEVSFPTITGCLSSSSQLHFFGVDQADVPIDLDESNNHEEEKKVEKKKQLNRDDTSDRELSSYNTFNKSVLSAINNTSLTSSTIISSKLPTTRKPGIYSVTFIDVKRKMIVAMLCIVVGIGAISHKHTLEVFLRHMTSKNIISSNNNNYNHINNHLTTISVDVDDSDDSVETTTFFSSIFTMNNNNNNIPSKKNKDKSSSSSSSSLPSIVNIEEQTQRQRQRQRQRQDSWTDILVTL